MGDMKTRVARTIKWNVADRLSSQILYAITGIVLARILSPDDFGLVGAILVFQAFASLFVDSGFSSALIQRKHPTRLDYSTVLWFNVGMATVIYVILWLCAPLIADCFQSDERLIPLSRVMFLSFIVNATSIVQINRLMKRMDVKMIAVSNGLGLAAGGVVGITMALTGWGAWAIVWQTITIGLVKSAILWATSRWLPLLHFSWRSLKSFMSVGMGVMVSSFLNTVFQNIYGFLIGNRVGLASLGYYTQADKWSKMGTQSMSQVLTSSFLPALSQYQDNPRAFASATAKMNRFTAWMLFPAIGLLCVMATPIFHLLFGTKWDPAIALFIILLLRGIFTVLTSLYNNYILSLGRSRLLVGTELVRDIAAIVAIIFTLPYIGNTTADNPCAGLRIFLIGQLLASALTWAVTLVYAARLSRRSIWEYITDCLPYLGITSVVLIPCIYLSGVIESDALLLASQLIVGAGAYLLINRAAGSVVQRDALGYITSGAKRAGQ